jgi:hypothetical protein
LGLVRLVRLGLVRLDLVRLDLVRLDLVRLDLVRLGLVRLVLLRLGLGCSGAPLKVRLVTLPTNIRLGWKGLSGTAL